MTANPVVPTRMAQESNAMPVRAMRRQKDGRPGSAAGAPFTTTSGPTPPKVVNRMPFFALTQSKPLSRCRPVLAERDTSRSGIRPSNRPRPFSMKNSVSLQPTWRHLASRLIRLDSAPSQPASRTGLTFRTKLQVRHQARTSTPPATIAPTVCHCVGNRPWVLSLGQSLSCRNRLGWGNVLFLFWFRVLEGCLAICLARACSRLVFPAL